MPELEVNGTRLYYQQSGQGPDVVLVHAVTSNQAVWLFTGLVDTLAAHFRVTSYDLRGHGASTVVKDKFWNRNENKASASGAMVARCCRARISVGAISAACRPASITVAAASSATTVLPEPTSPCSSRTRSETISATARCCDGVSE